MNATIHGNLINAALEGRVISSLLAHEREAVDLAMSRLDDGCFVNDSARALFTAIDAQLREIPANQKLDPNDVVYAAGGDVGRLRDFVMQHVGPITGTTVLRMVRADQIASTVDRLIKLRAKRAAASQAHRILTDLRDGKVDVRDALDVLRERLPTDTLPDAPAPWSMLSEIGASAEYRAGLQPITTGFATLDQVLGGFRPESVYVLGGRTGAAKSTMAANIARKVALLGHGVLLFKLEESQREATWRVHAAAAQVDLRALMSGKVDDDERRRLDDAWQVIRDIPLRISDTRNIDALERISKAHVAADGDLIIIDQLSMIEVGDVEDAFQRVTRVSARLRLLARDLHVPILLVAQVNRPAAKGKDRLTAHDLRDSGCLENDAAAVIMIDRARKPDGPIYGGQILRHLEIVVPKNRYGPTVFDEPLELLWWPVHCRIEDAAGAGGQA